MFTCSFSVGLLCFDAQVIDSFRFGMDLSYFAMYHTFNQTKLAKYGKSVKTRFFYLDIPTKPINKPIFFSFDKVIMHKGRVLGPLYLDDQHHFTTVKPLPNALPYKVAISPYTNKRLGVVIYT